MRLLCAGGIALGLFLVGCGSSSIDDVESLNEALQAAVPGDRVCIGAGRFEGQVVVPEGVTLCGAGAGATTIVGPSDRPAILVSPGVALATQVTELTVVASSDFAITAEGLGDVILTNLSVQVPTAGSGIGIENVTRLTIHDAEITGPVTPANADSVPLSPTAQQSGTHGLVVISATTAEVEDVHIRGFARFGALFVDSEVTTTGGSITDTLGTGLMISGGVASLNEMTLVGALHGLRVIPAYNAVFTDGASVTTTSLEASGSENFGVLHSEAFGRHFELGVSENREGGVWVQDTGIEIRGATFGDNALAGVAAVDASSVLLANVSVTGTRAITRISGGSAIQIGDGVNLLRTLTDVSLHDVNLTGNARVGFVVDTDDSGDTASFDPSGIDSVRVDGSGAQLGAIGQGAVPANWDTNVIRVGAPLINDPAFGGVLASINEIVGPSDIPVADAIRANGLTEIVGPSD